MSSLLTASQLYALAKAKNPKIDLALLRKALKYAEKAHAGQKLKTGDDFIQHPLHVAKLLAEIKLPAPILCAGLLHDTPECISSTDPQCGILQIKQQFNQDIADMVLGLMRLKQLPTHGTERYLENLRKMFVAVAGDVRIILIKLADRLHNLQMIDTLPIRRQLRMTLEVFSLYGPIANRLGMDDWKGQLEDMAFKYAYPREYQWLTHLALPKIEETEKIVKKIIKIVDNKLKRAKISYLSIIGRSKRLYSLYRKLVRYDYDLKKIYDLAGVRIILPDPPYSANGTPLYQQCYQVLGLLHQHWPPIPHRLRDFIANPKPNYYQSLHTTVLCEKYGPIEFQIRTKTMDEIARSGIAAHWYYYEGGKGPPPQKLRWVQELLQLQKSFTTNLLRLQPITVKGLEQHIFAFTPKGDVIDLPNQATILDLAYALHSHLGNQCIAAKILNQDNKIVTPETTLNGGEVIEIITAPESQMPKPKWLKIVKTEIAKKTIKKALQPKWQRWFAGKIFSK